MDIVEVRRNGYSVAAEMGQMRDWLNARQIVPVLFQFDGAVLRLGLESEDGGQWQPRQDGAGQLTWLRVLKPMIF